MSGISRKRTFDVDAAPPPDNHNQRQSAHSSCHQAEHSAMGEDPSQSSNQLAARAATIDLLSCARREGRTRQSVLITPNNLLASSVSLTPKASLVAYSPSQVSASCSEGCAADALTPITMAISIGSRCFTC